MLPSVRLSAFCLAAFLGLAPSLAARQRGAGAAPPETSPVTIALFSARPPQGDAPLAVEFVDRSFGGVTSWSWSFGDGTTSQLQNPTHVYTDGGVYGVTLTVEGPRGKDTRFKPQGVVVRNCTPQSARANRPSPLERGADFVPITGDDSLGFYCVYSGKAVAPNNPGISNNVGMFVLPLVNGEVLLFGSGYGDPNSIVEPTEDAAFDVRRIDGILRFCMGRTPASTPIRFVAPHGHIDHINADFIRELRLRGYPIVEIAFHSADASLATSLPGWTNADRALFRAWRNTTSSCQEELKSYDSPLGKLWFHLRAGHTAGSIDLVIDVRNDPGNRFVIRGSGAAFGVCSIAGVREGIEPHGNIQFSAPEPVLLAVAPATGSAIGGTEVVLSGHNFAAALAGTPQVLFDGTPASAVTVLDDDTLTCLAPPGLPGHGANLHLVNRNGQVALDGAFSYRPLPTLSALSPPHGVVSGGTRVTLTGSGFLANVPGLNRVTFGGVAASAVTVADDAHLACTTPSGVVGAADVLLSNLNGSAGLADGFLFDPVIDVTGVTPGSGTSRGGTRVQLSGSAFAVGTTLPQVFFAGTRATDVVRNSDTLLSCTTPAGAAGAQVDVRVSGDNGSDTLVGGFRYFAAPKVTAVAPASGPAAGGTALTITGSNFTRNSAGPNSVSFGGTPALGVVTLSDTALQCQAPPGNGGASVTVMVSNANGSGALDAGYRYRRAPSLTTLEPAFGPRSGGTLLTLRGAGFLESGAGTSLVRFGGVSATALTILDDQTLTCTTPTLGADGPVDVSFDNANGQATLAQAFRYVTRPTLAVLAPTAGPARGGSRVTLSGSGFQAAGAGPTEVRFGQALATLVRILDDHTLTCVAPLGVPGSRVAVLVRNQNGSARLDDAFGFLELPALAGLEPGEGPLAGGTRVSVRGAGFQAGGLPEMRFGNAAATNLVVLADDLLECTTPPGTPGAISVGLRTAAGAAWLREGFVYGSTRPEVLGVEPDHGASAAPRAVLIRGSNFSASNAGTNRVTFGGLPATSVVVQSDGRLACVPPAGAPGSRVDVQVSNDNGNATLLSGYRYHLQPALSALAPAQGSPLGDVAVTLSGSGFLVDEAGPATVRFGGLLASASAVLDDHTLSCRTPSGAPGSVVEVELVNANGSTRLTAAFHYLGAPSLDALAPVAGTPLGGTLVTLSGAGFTLDPAGAPLVRLGAATATQVAVVDDNTLTCLAPPGPAGVSVDVRVENQNGAAVLAGAYRYFAAPAIVALAPGNGPSAGGTSVVLTGVGFKSDVLGANAVTFGTRAARSVTTVDDTRVRAVAPLGTAGERVDVVLTNSNGSSSVPQGFRYNAAPTLTAFAPNGASALGGATITISGLGFQRDGAGANSVTFGANPASAVTVLDDQTLRCVAPPGLAGTSEDVRVVNANGSATAAFPYFAAPQLVELVPPFGSSAGGTLVELRGSGFLLNTAGAPGVSFGATPASQIAVLDDGRLQCLTPVGSAGAVTVAVTNANGGSLLDGGFFFDWAPTVTSFQPVAGSSLGGTEVRVEGAGFTTPGAGALTVRFGSNAASNVRVFDGQTLLCTSPSGPAGTSVAVVVANTHGSASQPGFRYHARPTLTSIEPALGPPEGGTLVTLRGAGFSVDGAGLPTVSFGGASASGVVVLDDATARCVSPAGAPRSSATLTLSNANGAAQIVDGFRWQKRDPSDLNDDGFGDLLLTGADGVCVFFGALSGLVNESTATADLLLRPALVGVDFGNQVASGDLNGDRLADLVISAPLEDGAGIDAGAVFVFFGPLAASPSPRLSSSANATFRGAAAGDRFGTALLVQDVSGDGTPDLVVGAPLNDTAGADGGAVYVYRGALGFVSQTTAQANARLLGSGNQHNFGASLAGGDVTGDLLADLAVGAPLQGAAGGNSGAAFVFRGGPTLVSASSSSAQVQLPGAGSGDHFGTSVAIGDFDGDGVEDLFVGAADARVGGNQGGAIYAFRGGATLVSVSATGASAIFESEVTGDRLGQNLALGDADGDGRVELLAGAPQFDLPAASSGRAYLLKGGAFLGGSIALRAWTILTAENSSGDGFGTGLSLTDLDGDGRCDLLIGAPFSNGGAVDSGRAYVFFGAALQATRSAAADDVTYTGANPAQVLGRDIGSAR